MGIPQLMVQSLQYLARIAVDMKNRGSNLRKRARGAVTVEVAIQVMLVALVSVSTVRSIGLQSESTFLQTEAGFTLEEEPRYAASRMGGEESGFTSPGGGSDSGMGMGGQSYEYGGGTYGTTPGSQQTAEPSGGNEVDGPNGGSGGEPGGFIP